MELSPLMKNMLAAIKDQTIKTRGKNKGEVKRRISANEYYQNTVNALFRRGLIDWKSDTKGTGYAATMKSLDY